jgi:hypothetical protein
MYSAANANRRPPPRYVRSSFFVTHPPRNLVISLLLAALALTLGLVVAVGPAAAKSKPPCWKTLINDWYDGRIDGTYPIHCYREALQHLPTDVETYSSAREDIKQALQQRITQGTKGGGTTTTTGGSSGAGAGGGTGGGGSGTSGGGQNGGGTSGGGSGGESASGGPVGDVFDATKPKSADSVPVPLIVLGAVAFVLMALGAAGFLSRRMRTRRVQLASAAATPPTSGKPPQSRG